jgi:hypothetical protein
MTYNRCKIKPAIHNKSIVLKKYRRPALQGVGEYGVEMTCPRFATPVRQQNSSGLQASFHHLASFNCVPGSRLERQLIATCASRPSH